MPDAGWYHDPSDAAQLRYFDGGSWTDQVQPSPQSIPADPPEGAPVSAPRPAAPAAPKSDRDRAWAALAEANAMPPGQSRQRARAEAQRMLQRAESGKGLGEEGADGRDGLPARTARTRRRVREFEVAGAEPGLPVAFLVNTICALLYAAAVYVTLLVLEKIIEDQPSVLGTIFGPLFRLFALGGLHGYFFFVGVLSALFTLGYMYAYARLLSWAFGAAAPEYRLRPSGPFSLLVVGVFLAFVVAITLGLAGVEDVRVLGLLVLAYLFVVMPLMIVNAPVMKVAAGFSHVLAGVVIVVYVAGSMWAASQTSSFFDSIRPSDQQSERVVPQQPYVTPPDNTPYQPGLPQDVNPGQPGIQTQ